MSDMQAAAARLAEALGLLAEAVENEFGSGGGILADELAEADMALAVYNRTLDEEDA